MKTVQQLAQAISELGPETAKVLQQVVESGDTFAVDDPQLCQFMAALDVLRWMATDSEQRSIMDYLGDQSREESFLQYIESFGERAAT